MTVLYFIIPLALIIAGGAVAAFVWTVRSGQLDDVDTPPHRMLLDDAQIVAEKRGASVAGAVMKPIASRSVPSAATALRDRDLDDGPRR